jgi:DNA-binding transcriptional LysR family regulator
MNLDLDCIRTFVAIFDAGSFARAAERVGRSLSAVSLQIDRLEAQVGQALFRKEGRRMVPTPAGEKLRDHARALLAANDAVLAAMRKDQLSGRVRMGILHDVLEQALAEALGEFTAMHPQVRLEIVVDRSRALVDAVETGMLDQAIGFEFDSRLPTETIMLVPVVWIGRRMALEAQQRPLPLVLLDEPCSFRRAALAALDDAGIGWRIVLTSPSLAAVRAAVMAGLGVTVRTPHFLGSPADRLSVLEGLPALAATPLKHYRRVGEMSPAAEALKAACIERIRVW